VGIKEESGRKRVKEEKKSKKRERDGKSDLEGVGGDGGGRLGLKQA